MRKFLDFPKYKKIILIIVFAIVLVRVCFIAFRDEIDKEYIVSAEYDLSEAERVSCEDVCQRFLCDFDRLNSLEFIFDGVPEDKTGEIVVRIKKGDELIYQTNVSLANVNNLEWEKIYVNTEMLKNQEYSLKLYASESCTKIPDMLVVNNGSVAHEIVESIVDGQNIDGDIAINYGYLREPGTFDKICVISLWLVFYLIVILLVEKFENTILSIKKLIEYIKKQVDPQILLTALEMIGCFVIINCSGILFQPATQAILYSISLVSVINYGQKTSFLDSIFLSGRGRVSLIVLYLYAAFSLVGQRIFIYPLNKKFTLAGTFVFFCTFLWFIPVVNTILYHIDKLKRVVFLSSNSKTKTWKFIAISICFLWLPALYNLFANNPGISSYDSVVSMIDQAQHLHGSGDWHPAFYCMILRSIQKVWNSTYAVILVQYFFWIYVCLETILYFRKKGINEKVLLVLAAFLGCNSANYIHVNTIWKDIPYTLSLYWSVIILSKLIIDYEEYKGKWYIYLELITSLIGISLYRKNGIVPFCVIIISLVVIMKKNIKVWLSVIISIVLFGIIKGPIYNHFDIQPVEYGMYIGLSQDILGVYYAGGEVSEDTIKMINVMTNYNNAEYDYTPTWSYQTYGLNVDAKEFIVNYLDTFLKNPVVMSRAIIDREDAIWDIYAGQDSVLGCVNFYETAEYDPVWTEQYGKRYFISLYNWESSISNYIASSQWLSSIVWRCGAMMLLSIIAVIYMFLSKIKWQYVLLLSPSIGHILSLLLSTGWSDFRYFWPLNMLNTFLIFIVLVVANEREKI